MTTHYVRAFAARAICGALGPHHLDPSCPDCRKLLALDESINHLDYQRTEQPGAVNQAALQSRSVRAIDQSQFVGSINGYDFPSPYPEVNRLMAEPPPASPPCLDGSTEACVPAMPLVDVPRCVYCRRELR